MAEFKGKKVTLNKPRNISKGSPGYGRKQKEVFVKDGDRVKQVTFGDPNMKNRKNEPKREKRFVIDITAITLVQALKLVTGLVRTGNVSSHWQLRVRRGRMCLPFLSL